MPSNVTRRGFLKSLVAGAPDEDSCALNTDTPPDQTNGACADAGAVYAYRKSVSGWVQEAYVKASNTGAGDKFGLDHGV